MAAVDVADTRELDHQFERIRWALFLIMLSGLGLVPGVPSGSWLSWRSARAHQQGYHQSRD